jgi:hypothetical protein
MVEDRMKHGRREKEKRSKVEKTLPRVVGNTVEGRKNYGRRYEETGSKGEGKTIEGRKKHYRGY